MSHDTECTHITSAKGNVFLDMGFTPTEAEHLLAEPQRRITEKMARNQDHTAMQKGQDTSSHPGQN